MYDLVIVGGGPAGITAGIYAARKKLRTALVSADFIGQVGLTGPIENWPGEPSIVGAGLMEKFEDHVRRHELNIIEEEVLSIDKPGEQFIIKTEEADFTSRSVLLATGRTPRRINVPGEWEYTGRGVVYCTTCDAPVYQDKTVVVVGGGNNGFASAIELTDYASEVTLLEIASECRADELLQDRAADRGVVMCTEQTITQIHGDDYVTGVTLQDGSKMTIDGVFVEIGSTPNAALAPSSVQRTDDGEIEIDFYSCATNLKGFYAAGDVTNIRDKQIVTATAEGAKAALSVYEYLRSVK